ncbi:uncharacterized protein [Epargyreus clarus]|uniref:uncharacterized protein n=1 Tax=Epargyreus clarus TaxID=520877 RepID=UPI003C3085E0
MGKRRSAEKERDKIARKIRKLNKKLQAMAEASDSESIESVATSPATEIPLTPTGIEELNQIDEEAPSQTINEEPIPILDKPIGADILDALGNIEEIQEGPTVHAEIVRRWIPIVTKGLPKDMKIELMTKHIPFENMPTLTPRLNPEIMAAVSENIKKRDSIIAERQKQVGAALVAIGKSLELCIHNDDNIDIIKNMNDAAKIMCDTIYIDTQSRRSLIAAVINKDMKESLTDEAGTFLFGNDLSEKIKATKAVQRSVKDLKTTYVMATRTPGKPKSLNWRGPPRPYARAPTGGKPTQPGKQQKKENKKPRQLFQNNRNNNTYRR